MPYVHYIKRLCGLFLYQYTPPIHSSLLHTLLLWLSNLQNHYLEGEEKVKADFSKLHEDMQEAFRKLEE